MQRFPIVELQLDYEVFWCILCRKARASWGIQLSFTSCIPSYDYKDLYQSNFHRLPVKQWIPLLYIKHFTSACSPTLCLMYHSLSLKWSIHTLICELSIYDKNVRESSTGQAILLTLFGTLRLAFQIHLLVRMPFGFSKWYSIHSEALCREWFFVVIRWVRCSTVHWLSQGPVPYTWAGAWKGLIMSMLTVEL